jgi:hypothetical protein
LPPTWRRSGNSKVAGQNSPRNSHRRARTAGFSSVEIKKVSAPDRTGASQFEELTAPCLSIRAIAALDSYAASGGNSDGES